MTASDPCSSTQVLLTTTLLNAEHQRSALGNAMTMKGLTPFPGQATSSPQTSPEMVEMVHPRFLSTVVQRSQDLSRALDQVSKTTFTFKCILLKYMTLEMKYFIIYMYIFVSGLYSPERSGRSIFRTAPAYSLSGREKEGSRKQTPGSVLFGVSFLWAWVSLQKQYKLCLAPTQVQRLIVCLLCWGPKLWPYLQLQPGHSVVALKAGASTRTYRRYIWKQLPWEVKAILFHIL